MKRRQVVTAATAAMLSGCAVGSGREGSRQTFLLVHGAWHGGWCWEATAGHLRRQGHTVLAPTLPGMEEGAASATAQTDLHSHIRAVVDLIDREGLRDFVLVGHSYGGMVISGVADQRAEHIRRLVYLDAFLPRDGQRLVDFMAPTAWRAMQEGAEKTGRGFLVPSPPPAFFGLPPDLAAAVQPRLTPQPIATFTQPIRFTRGGWKAVERRTYIACDQPAIETLAPIKQQLKADPGWRYESLATGHDAMLTQPEALAGLLEAATQA